jgi:nitroimidazol reductase NimA-like FMN-containing flavoprotein (pyridoxamine 5'-phosphate oxidase superfamily)
MLGELTIEDSEQVLHTEVLGRLGCHARGRTYVVPVAYAYDNSSIFSHTGDGLKIRVMRENPKVCFEVEQLADLPSWRSVIAFGRFEELGDDAARAALELLRARLRGDAAVHGRHVPRGLGLWVPGDDEARPRESIVYAIRVDELTGRVDSAKETQL